VSEDVEVIVDRMAEAIYKARFPNTMSSWEKVRSDRYVSLAAYMFSELLLVSNNEQKQKIIEEVAGQLWFITHNNDWVEAKARRRCDVLIQNKYAAARAGVDEYYKAKQELTNRDTSHTNQGEVT